MLGGALLSVVATGWWMYGSYKSSDDVNSLPCLSAEETEMIMHALNDKVKIIMGTLQRTIDTIKQKFAAQGQQCDDAQLKEHLILPNFLKEFSNAEAEVLELFDVDSDELEDAVKHYSRLGNNVIIDLSKNIKIYYKNLGGVIETESSKSKSLKDSITLEQILTIIDSLAHAINTRTDQYILAFMSDYGAPSNQSSLTTFNSGMAAMQGAIQQEILSSNGLTEQEFSEALMKHQTELVIQEKLTNMQRQQQLLLQKHGLMMI